jgi:hypothetical protein
MPLARYFALVGGALLALLFVSEAYFPKLPDSRVGSEVDKSIIRIHSDRKWPERIVFDTTRPTFIPDRAAQNTELLASAPRAAELPVGESARDSFAQLQSSDRRQAQVSEPKKVEKKLVRKRMIAKRRTAPPPMMLAQQPPQFGFFGHSTW